MQQLIDGSIRFLQLKFLHHLFHKCFTVVLVDNHKVFRVAETIDFFAQNLHTQPVNGAYIVVGRAHIHQAVYAIAHFHGSLVGKGHAQHIGGVDAHAVNQIGISIGEHTSLTRPGTCHHSHTALCSLHSLALLTVKMLEYLLVHISKKFQFLFFPY